MAKKLSTLISDFLQRSQLDPTDARYTDLLSVNTEISDETYQSITSGLSSLMTTDEARNNVDIQRHFRQQSLNPVDTEIERWLDELEAPDDIKADIAGQRNSYTRLRRTLEKTRELESQKLTAASQSEKRDIQRRLDELTAQLTSTQQKADTRITQLQSESDQRLTDFALRSALAGRRYANNKLSPEQNSADARALLDAHLRGKGAALAIDNDNNALRLMSASTPDAPYQENGKNIDFNDFLDSFLASKGILQITDPSQPQPSGTTFITGNRIARRSIQWADLTPLTERIVTNTITVEKKQPLVKVYLGAEAGVRYASPLSRGGIDVAPAGSLVFSDRYMVDVGYYIFGGEITAGVKVKLSFRK